MTIAEYIEYVEMKRQSWRNSRSYFPIRYENTNINSFHHDKSKVLDYPHHYDDSKINGYYDLPPLLPCFKPVQPHIKDRYEPLKEDTDYISDDKSETSEQRMINHTDGDKPFTPKPQHEDRELSSDEDLDDALIAILKSLVGECKAVYVNKGAQIETSSDRTNEAYEMSFITDDDNQNEEGVISGDLPVSVNVIPKSICEHLKLANLKGTNMVVEMTDITKKPPLGIVENILVKINKFLFPSDFIIIDMLGEPSETMILGRPFLATIHAQIDIFNRENSLGIREDRVLFDMDGGVFHSKIHIEKVYMEKYVQEEEYFNPLEIKEDVFSYESSACLLFEQCTRSCDNESIDTFDSVDNMQEHEVKHEDTFDIKADYGRTRDDPYLRRFGEYKKVFDSEIEQLANEYDLRIGKKGMSWMTYGESAKNSMVVCYTHGTMRDSRKKSDGKVLDDALPLGRANGSRFMGMIRKEMEEEGGAQRKTTLYPLRKIRCICACTSQETMKNKVQYAVNMDDPNIIMEQYIHLEEEKARRHGIPSYCLQRWIDSEQEISFEPTVSYFNDFDHFKDFEKEFPTIAYNDTLTSDFSTEPTISPQHIDEFDETSLSECDDEGQNVIYFNDLFSFNVIYPDDLSDKDNDNDKIDIEHSSGDLSIKPLPIVIKIDTQGSNKLLETNLLNEKDDVGGVFYGI
ncbi:phospholipase-like protein [Tanacetum coccineum]